MYFCIGALATEVAWRWRWIVSVIWVKWRVSPTYALQFTMTIDNFFSQKAFRRQDGFSSFFFKATICNFLEEKLIYWVSSNRRVACCENCESTPNLNFNLLKDVTIGHLSCAASAPVSRLHQGSAGVVRCRRFDCEWFSSCFSISLDFLCSPGKNIWWLAIVKSMTQRLKEKKNPHPLKMMLRRTGALYFLSFSFLYVSVPHGNSSIKNDWADWSAQFTSAQPPCVNGVLT